MGIHDSANLNRYIDVLPKILDSYCGSVHSSKGFATKSVNQDAAMVIREKVLLEQQIHEVQQYLVDDHVRLVKEKQTFEKGHETNFTDNIFEVAEDVPKGKIFLSRVSDLAYEPVKGLFTITRCPKSSCPTRRFIASRMY